MYIVRSANSHSAAMPHKVGNVLMLHQSVSEPRVYTFEDRYICIWIHYFWWCCAFWSIMLVVDHTQQHSHEKAPWV